MIIQYSRERSTIAFQKVLRKNISYITSYHHKIKISKIIMSHMIVCYIVCYNRNIELYNGNILYKILS